MLKSKLKSSNEIDDAKSDLPEAAFSQEYMAEFNDNAANPFGLNYIQQCIYPMSNEPVTCFGIDLAKSSDFTVIIGLDRFCSVCYFERFQMDWKQTTQRIMDLPDKPMAIDSTGVGDPIAENVSAYKDVEMFKFNQNSKQQLMEGLAMKIQKREIMFPEGMIKDELENFEFQYGRTGVKYAAPSGLHDDCVCALALAVHKFKKRGTGHYDII